MYIRIEQRIKRRIVKKILCLILLAAAIGGLLIISFRFCDRAEKIFSVLLSVIIYIFLFLKVGLIPLLRDTPWTGIVEGRACKKVTRIQGVVAHRENIHDAIVAYWKIRKDDGDEIVMEFDTEEIADDYFHTGDRVRHFKGAKFIVLAEPEEDNENLLCPLCGKMVMKPKCSFCKIDFSMPSPKETDSFADSV